jgi:hypothetical protein
MEIAGFDIPSGWESMSCIHDCGFFIVWKIGSPESFNVAMVMEGHLEGHEAIRPTFWDWLRYGREK